MRQDAFRAAGLGRQPAGSPYWMPFVGAPRRPGRQPRPLTERQLRKRMEAVLDEVAALGGAYQLTASQIRRRLLLLERQVQDMIERLPPG